MRMDKYILMIGFILVMIVPLLNNGVHIFERVSSTENRKLSAWPQFNACSIDEFIKGMENYLIDHLDVRNNAIRFHNKLNVFVFRSSPSPVKALVGKNNWLYLSGEELRTFVGTELFTDNELREFKEEIIKRKKIVASYNAKLIIAIVPNKPNIYPEFMPDHIIKSLSGGYGQQMQSYLKKNGLPVIDLYTTLNENKDHRDIYFKTDNHWNDLGAFVATNAILKVLRTSSPTVKLLDTLDYPVRVEEKKDGCLSKMLNVENEIKDVNHRPYPRANFKSAMEKDKRYPVIKDFAYPWEYEEVYHQQDTSLPRVLVIRDSFGKALLPYLSEQCHICVGIWDAWNYGLNEAIIKDCKPDFVIYLIAESQLKNVMKYATK